MEWHIPQSPRESAAPRGSVVPRGFRGPSGVLQSPGGSAVPQRFRSPAQVLFVWACSSPGAVWVRTTQSLAGHPMRPYRGSVWDVPVRPEERVYPRDIRRKD